MKLSEKEKGLETIFSFFEAEKQKLYHSPFNLIGQNNDDSCVTACVRMILADFGIRQSEAFVASSLETSGGAYLSKIPVVIKEFELKSDFIWRDDLTFEDLKNSIIQQSVIVSVKRKEAKFGHALIIDAMIGNEVRLRDPLPRGQGKSYAVSVDNFKEVWLKENGKGNGVVYDK
jgi:ABC-type bacteriocin/lantibiotic exporter with double-glycine peptidase domain